MKKRKEGGREEGSEGRTHVPQTDPLTETSTLSLCHQQQEVSKKRETKRHLVFFSFSSAALV